MTPSFSSRQVIAKQLQLLKTRSNASNSKKKVNKTITIIRTLEKVTELQTKRLQSEQKQFVNAQRQENAIVQQLEPYLKPNALACKHKTHKKVHVSQKLLKRLKDSLQKNIKLVDSRTKKRDWLPYAVEALTPQNAFHMQGPKCKTCVLSSFANYLQLFFHRIGFFLEMSPLIEVLLHQVYVLESRDTGNCALTVPEIVTAFNKAVCENMLPLARDTSQNIPGYDPSTKFYLRCEVNVLFSNTQQYQGVKEFLRTPCTRSEIYMAIQEEGDWRHAVVVQGTGLERAMKYDPHCDKSSAILVDIKKLKFIYKLDVRNMEIMAVKHEKWHTVEVPLSMGGTRRKKRKSR